MFPKKTLTANFRRFLTLALVSAGVFSLLTSCGLRESSDHTVPAPVQNVSVMKNASADRKISASSPLYEIISNDYSIVPEAVEWITLYNSRHGENAASDIIMTQLEIAVFNRRIDEKCPNVVDISSSAEPVSGDEIRKMIVSYALPGGELYDRTGSLIIQSEKNAILTNRNIDEIPESVVPRLAVITSRCSLKSLPTKLDMFAHGDTYYSKIQETELIASFPVQVLHTSADGEFLFVQSYFYFGWIPADSAAYCSEEEYAFFSSPDNFVVITKPVVEVSSSRLDMGSILPYDGENEDYYFVFLPVNDSDGNLLLTKAEIPRRCASFGWLSYTAEHFYSQAFEYLGTDYDWGGSEGGVDCSGFVCSVFRSFGIYLPRNTGEQIMCSDMDHNLSGKSKDQMLSAFDELNSPAMIHRPGHVMLFLGMQDGIPHVIHAPEGGQKVSVMALTYMDNLQALAVLDIAVDDK